MSLLTNTVLKEILNNAKNIFNAILCSRSIICIDLFQDLPDRQLQLAISIETPISPFHKTPLNS